MKNIILTMCIVAYATIFSSCSTDDSTTDTTKMMQPENANAALKEFPQQTPFVLRGAITGSFFPVIPAEVTAIPSNSKDIVVYSGYVDAGFFKIPGVPVGTYTISIVPKDDSVLPIRVRGVEVQSDRTTDIGAHFFYDE